MKNHKDTLRRFSYYTTYRSCIKVLVVIALLFASIHSNAQNKSYPFKPGEKLTYNMKFGWFNVGKAVVWLDPEFYYPNKDGVPHYKVQFRVTTASWFRIFSHLRLCMESLMEVDQFKPLISDRDMESKNSIDIRHDYFSFGNDIKVKAYIEDLDEWRYHKFPKKDTPIRDALSTYMWLRNRDKSQFKTTVEIRVFFSNDLYEFKMLPGNSTTYKYNNRKVKAFEHGLVFPEGEYFDKGKTGSVTMSNDRNRFPLKFEVDMTVGSFILELEKVEYIN